MPGLSLLLLALLSLALSPHCAEGLVISGSVPQQDSSTHVYYIGKFAYEVGNSTFFGNFTAPAGVVLALFDDQEQSWPFVIANQGDCQQQLAAARQFFYASQDGSDMPVTLIVTEQYIRWWYAAFVACDEPIQVDTYSFTFLNGGTSQLSWNQNGLPTVYAVFFAFLLTALLAVVVIPSLRRMIRHSMSVILLSAILLECVSRMFMLSYYWNINDSGVMATSVLGFGEWLDQLSQATLLGLSLFIAFGWNFPALNPVSKIILIGGVFLYLFLGLILVIWGTTVHDSYQFIDTLLATSLGAVLITVRLLILGVCIGAAHMNMKNERRMERALWTRRFVVVTAIWQALYILFGYVVHGVPSYHQALFIWTSLSFFNTVYFAILLFAMQPSMIGDLFGSPFNATMTTSNSSHTEEFLEDSRT